MFVWLTCQFSPNKDKSLNKQGNNKQQSNMKTGVLIVWGENPLGQLGSEWRRSNSIRKDKQCVNKTFKSRPILLLTAEICDDVMRGFVWWRVVWGRPFTWSSTAVSQVLQHGSNYISLIWWKSEELNNESRGLLLLFSFFVKKENIINPDICINFTKLWNLYFYWLLWSCKASLIFVSINPSSFNDFTSLLLLLFLCPCYWFIVLSSVHPEL